MQKTTLLSMLLAASASAALPPAPATPATPATPVKPVVDDYFGTKISDPYRWMEDMQSPEWKTWLKAQADHASSVLATLPRRETLKNRLLELSNAQTGVGGLDKVAGRLFLMKTEPGRNMARLFVVENGKERLLLDPDTLKTGTAPVAIDFYSPSPDGRLVAIGVSAGGTEDSELRIMNLKTGAWLSERISRAGLNQHGVSWLKDGKRFFYNRLPAPGADGVTERYNKSAAYLHTVGQDAEQDQPVLGMGVHPDRPFEIADIPQIFVAAGSSHALAEVLHGDAVEKSYFIAPLDQIKGKATPWVRIISPADKVSAVSQRGNTLYLHSNLDAPRGQLLSLDLQHPEKRSVVLAQSSAILRESAVARDGLYLRMSEGGIDQLLKLPNKGKPQTITLPVQGTLSALLADSKQDGLMFRLESWLSSAAIYTFDGRSKLVDSKLQAKSPVDFSAYQAQRVLVKSHDGVEVPLSILSAKSLQKDGRNPTIVSGYGAYGIVMEARFSPSRLAWLEQGGVMATCHVRGGGEFGEEWHRGAYIHNKANTAKDFIACADYLVKAGYTSPAKLAGTGGSAGGITIGGAITARPDLFAAAQSAVGVSDMLRMEFTPNGPPNIQEFGTVTKEADFKAMLSNSPYHRIKDGVAYPAVIVTTGANDPRVDAWMPGKLAARLQAANSSANPVILRVDYDGGHGMGSSKAQRAAETADVWSFFLWRMAVPASLAKQ